MGGRKRKLLILAAIFMAPLVGALSLYFLFADKVEKEIKETTVEQIREYDEQLKITPSKVVPVTLSQEEMQAAMGTAEEFAKRFHLMDPKNPFRYVEEAKPYMTDEMYAAYKEVPKRGTLTMINETLLGIEIWPNQLGEKEQIYQVDVHSETESVDGTKTPTLTEYLVQLKPVGDEWKVNGVNVNGW